MDSLLALQTEVLRKGQESKKELASDQLKPLTLKKNRETSSSKLKLKQVKDDFDEEADLQKSRAMMEAKSKFYDRMQNSKGIGSDGSKRYLVDFEKKILDDPSKIEQIKTDGCEITFDEPEAVFGPVHYQHLRENEIRELGVGYFDFSLDEETRQKQLEELKEMHKETQERQQAREQGEKLRQLALQDRLNKIRSKRNLPLDETVVEMPANNAISTASSEREIVSEIKHTRAESRLEALNSNREWDNRKRTLGEVMEAKLKKSRDEREPEFAPPKIYEETCTKNKKSASHTISNLAGTGNFISSLGNAMKSLEQMYDNGVKNVKSGLSLPREGEIAGLVIGDSIQKRIIAENISDYVFVRGFGGAKAKDISERLSYTPSRKVKHVILAIGLNDALACNADDVEFSFHFKRSVELIVQKFTPDVLQVASLTPTRGDLAHVNFYIDRINALVKELFNELVYPGTNVQLLDVNAAFHMAISPLSQDGLHPSTEGVMVLVQCYRQQFEASGIEVNWEQEVQVRSAPEREKGYK